MDIYFKDKNNKVFSIAAGFEGFLNGDLVKIEKSEAMELIKPSAADLKLLEAEKVKAELSNLDVSTIRAMREYIASKTDAPQILKDRETLAAQLRAKLK